MFSKLKEWLKTHITKNFLARYSVIIALAIISLYGMAFRNEVIWTVYYITLAETMALILAGIGTYSFTRINFIKEIRNGSTDMQKLAYYIILSSIFLSTHIVVGLASYGIFLASKP